MLDVSKLEAQIAAEHDNICELIAIKDEKTAIEMYRHGYVPGDALNVMSVTKSIVSLLIGIAIDLGFVGSVQDKVLDYFPDYVTKRGEKTIGDITLHQLLTMTAPYKYRSEPWTKVCTSDDWTRAALDILGGRAGITGEFKYSTLGIQILTGIIAGSSDMSVTEFANKYLFGPLGIAPHKNADADTKEDQLEFLMSKAPKGDVWFADPQGVNTAGWGLALGAKDMASVGRMCLDRGVYNGRRILPETWIDKMTVPYVRCDERFANMSYGYLWWIIDEAKPVYAAIGDGGNVIYVDTATDTVVAIAATFKPRVFDRIELITGQIEPMLS